MTVNPEVQKGEKWALTWSEEDGFQMVRPGHLPGDSDVPPQAVYLSALSALTNNEEFVDGIMEWFHEDFANWKNRKRQ